LTTGDQVISVNPQTLSFNVQSVTLAYDMVFGVAKQDLTFTINGTTVSVGADQVISANYQSLNFAPKTAAINIVQDITFGAGMQSLNLNALAAALKLDQSFLANVQALNFTLQSPIVRVQVADGKVKIVIEALQPAIGFDAARPNILHSAKRPFVKIEGD
jgi:hypothetical protein